MKRLTKLTGVSIGRQSSFLRFRWRLKNRSNRRAVDALSSRSHSHVAILVILAALAFTPAVWAQQDQRLVRSAIEAYQHKVYNRAISDLNAAIRINPRLAVAYWYRGQCYKVLHQYDKAIADYSETIRLDPNDAKAYCSRAFVYSQKGDGQRALADYSEAIRLNPKYQIAYYSRALIDKQEGNHSQAIADATKAVRLNPKDADAFATRGSCYMFLRQFDKAVADLDYALRLNPNNRTAFNTRAGAYCYLGRHKDGVSQLQEEIRRNPGGADAYNELAWILATFPESSVRNGKSAVEYANKACQLAKGHEPHYVDTLAAAYAEAGDFADAVKWETRYIEFPILTQHWISIGRERLALYRSRKPLRADY
jgi:tetratricopeptide (TPR) repeat protein